jgi:hypothetical protein
MHSLRAAVICEGLVENIIVADAARDPAPPGCVLVDVTGRECDIGWVQDAVTGDLTGPGAPDESQGV